MPKNVLDCLPKVFPGSLRYRITWIRDFGMFSIKIFLKVRARQFT